MTMRMITYTDCNFSYHMPATPGTVACVLPITEKDLVLAGS
jgi:hypothetical protein